MKKVENKNIDIDKLLLIILLSLVIIIVLMIPLLYIAEVKKLLSVCLFIIIPVTLGIGILLLSRVCILDYNKKKRQIINKLKK